MSATDCILGPLARAARKRGCYIAVWRREGEYRAETEVNAGRGRTAQEACDELEAHLERKRK